MIHTASSEHETRVLYGRVARGGEQGKAGDGQELEAQQKDAALPVAVGEPAPGDGEEAGEDVRRHAHELRLVGRVSHVPDYGRGEEGEGVDRAEGGVAYHHVNVDLPVFNGLPDVFNVEFVGQMAVVFAEPSLYLFALLRREKSGAKTA